MAPPDDKRDGSEREPNEAKSAGARKMVALACLALASLLLVFLLISLCTRSWTRLLDDNDKKMANIGLWQACSRGHCASYHFTQTAVAGSGCSVSESFLKNSNNAVKAFAILAVCAAFLLLVASLVFLIVPIPLNAVVGCSLSLAGATFVFSTIALFVYVGAFAGKCRGHCLNLAGLLTNCHSRLGYSWGFLIIAMVLAAAAAGMVVVLSRFSRDEGSDKEAEAAHEPIARELPREEKQPEKAKPVEDAKPKEEAKPKEPIKPKEEAKPKEAFKPKEDPKPKEEAKPDPKLKEEAKPKEPVKPKEEVKRERKRKAIDWPEIRRRLPMEKTPEQKAARNKLYLRFDPNNNGYLDLAETEKGCRDVLGLYEIFDAKPVVKKAFITASAVSDGKKKGSRQARNDSIERSEFRLLLVYLRQYFEVWQMFDEIDASNDGSITFEEFKKVLPRIEAWGVRVSDPQAVFKEMDRTRDGTVGFDEFADWAVKKNLDLDTDDD